MKLRLHIYQKVIVVFLLLLGSVYLISLWINILGSRYLQDEILKTTMLNTKFYSQHFSEQFEFIKKLQLQLVSSSDVQNLNFNSADILKYSDVEATDRVIESLATVKDSNTYIKNAGIYIKPLNKTFSFNSGISNIPNEEFKIVEKRLLNTNRNTLMDIIGNKLYIFEVYPQIPGKSVKTAKIVVYFEIDKAAIENTLKRIITNNNSGTVLCDDSFNSIISSQEYNGFVSKLNKDSLKKCLESEGISKFQSKVDGKDYWIIFDRIKILNINLISYVSVNEVSEPLKKLNLGLIILSVVSVMIILVFSFLVNIMIHKPMEGFKRAFKELQADNFDISIEHESNDEFGYLFKSFNSMVKRLKLSIQENYEQKLALQQSELKQLQSQINPHFLYNSFFNIYRMCKSENYEDVATITQKLGSYYQFITRSGFDEVPLNMEYRHVMDYIDIQTIRFSNRIKITVDDLPDECKNLMVPKIILQPIIENIFKYVFEDKLEGGNIYMKIKYDNNILTIEVEDDGTYIGDQELAKLQERLKNAQSIQEKTGLINVCCRIRLKYGLPSGIMAEKSQYGGLKIVLMICY